MSSILRILGLTLAVVTLTACGGGSSGGSEEVVQPPPTTPTSYLVTTSVTGSGSGTVSPTSRTVSHGSTTSFTISAASGSTIASVSGCGGSLSDAIYTTGQITANCTVTALFEESNTNPPPLTTFTVTTAVSGDGSGTVSPSSATVGQGQTITFTVRPGSGSAIGSVTGCGGVLSGNSFTTGPIEAPCVVSAEFLGLPQAQASSLTAFTDETATGTLSGTSSSTDPLSFRIDQNPNHGSLSLNPLTGAFEYLPNSGFVGADYFSFTVIAGTLESEPARIDISVREWAGTVRLGNIAESPPFYSLAHTVDGGFAVASATSVSLTNATVSDGSDLFLATFDKHGHAQDMIQLALPERQQSYQLLGSPDGGYFLSYVSTLDVEGKQVELAQRAVQPDWSIELSAGNTVAIPFTLANPMFLSEIEILGLTLNWDADYLSDRFRLAIASDINGAPGQRVGDDSIRSQLVSYTLDGGQVQEPASVVLMFRNQLAAGNYWLLLSYVGDGAGFLLDSQVGVAPGISTCLNGAQSCLDFSGEPSDFSWAATNQGVGLKIRGIEGNYTLTTRGVLKLTSEGAVAWNWIAPDGMVALYRMAVDRLGNVYVLMMPSLAFENSRLLILNPQGVLLQDRVIEPQGIPPAGCEHFATARSIAISELNEVIVGGQVTRLFCSEGMWGGPLMMAYSQTGEVLWWLDNSLPAGTNNINRVQYLVAESSGPLGFTYPEPHAIRVDTLGNLVGVRTLSLDHSFFLGASNAAGEVLLFGETASGNAGSDLKATKLSRAAAIDWSVTIGVTQTDGSEVWEQAGNALLLDDGSALVLAEAPGDLPNSPRISERDIVIIRIAPDGTVDY